MNLKQFCKEVNINIYYTNVGDLRTVIFNIHTLNLSDELKLARLNLLIELDKLLDTEIHSRIY